MTDIKEIADNADVIVNGYAFTKCDLGYRVLNLNRPSKIPHQKPMRDM
ncbi:MAG: hypothetical protein LUG99_10550 [Lachnospiraceae bacterium]|nr:hypothetical protein [Lachnospiraceae bacterium]